MDAQQKTLMMIAVAGLTGGFAVAMSMFDYADGTRSLRTVIMTIVLVGAILGQWYCDRFRRGAAAEVVDGWLVLAMMALLFVD